MRDFLGKHVSHFIGCGPHAFADLRLPRQSTSEADIDVMILIGLYPGSVLHVVFSDHRAGLNGGVNLVSRPIEEARIDEDYAMPSGLDGSA